MKVSIYALFFYTLKINRLGAIFFLRSKLTLGVAFNSEVYHAGTAGGRCRVNQTGCSYETPAGWNLIFSKNRKHFFRA
ncbi:MAG: hypothetical protein H6557_31140 [Lewinellaceae bacterium]|nr:hypothetical protein [Phaeodactylibacter sp.]MCB9041107.1 hypothetical protein [Lewinellaceae bacterium]